MAKNPKNEMDDEAVIRRRDNTADMRFEEPLDSDARGLLADSRLRALAFALGAEPSKPAGSAQIEDTELLSYLLDLLPEHQRLVLEDSLRGNAPAVGRLMTLRWAFNTETDTRDRQRADDPARGISRHVAGLIEIRRLGDRLQFRHARASDLSKARAEISTNLQAFSLREEAPRRGRTMAFKRSFREPPTQQISQGRKAGRTLGAILAAVSKYLIIAKHLADEAQPLLDQWEEVDIQQSGRAHREQRGDFERIAHARALAQRLDAMMQELQKLTDQIRDNIRASTETTAGMLDMGKPASFIGTEQYRGVESALTNIRQVLDVGAVPAELDVEQWAATQTIEAGGWNLELSGTVQPTPQVSVTLRSDSENGSDDRPFLTLVRAQAGFECADIDSTGRASFALPVGASSLLVQGTEVWEVRLSLMGE